TATSTQPIYASSTWDATGGTFNSASSTVEFTSTMAGKTITVNDNSFWNLTFNGSGGGWTFQDDATTTNDFTIIQGTATSSSGTLSVGGDWLNLGTFNHGSGTVIFNSALTGIGIYPNSSLFHVVTFNNSLGGWSITGNATSSDNWNLTNADSFRAEGWYDSDWLYRKRIIIDHTKVSTTTDSFPVLISITDSDLTTNAREDGYDILFTSSDGITKLDHEIEQYASTTGVLASWVETPVSSAEDITLYMYYGYAGASNQQNSSGVWDSGYKMVQHFGEDSASTTDSTVNNNTGSAYSGATPISLATTTGQISGAISLDGNDDYVLIPYSSELDFNGNFTLSF
ncbi:MAG: DUF2341 domain-containing protein, partial [Candidatus Pacebacteria bacterium]|nr:DUF2341 domain-containing protein [Candidatus Paceibacterota bacterium]